jgi:hypothetical protein
VGDRASFHIVETMEGPYVGVTATMRYVSQHLYMWVQDGFDVSDEQLQASAARFDEATYPTNLRYFGSDWLRKLNEPRISVFNGNVSGAYFYSPDEYPRAVKPYSNEREMVYISLNSWQPGTDSYDATLAHEFQHLIHFHYDSHDDGWVNEGLAELAKEINGYPSGLQNAFQEHPNTQLDDWDGSDAHYGAAFALMSYLLDRFGETLIRDLVADPLTGVASMDHLLGERGTTFDAVYADWVAANLIRDPSADEGRFGYQKITMPAAAIEAELPRAPSNATGNVLEYGTVFTAVKASLPVTVAFHGTVTVPIAPMTPHSGRYAYWSNEGDSSDMTLTRSLDLRGAVSPTLSAWLWYDIEEDWDYAYVAASSDGGNTWTPLTCAETRTTDPHGNAWGPGLTGRSGQPPGGTGEPQWVKASFDLSQFEGKVALIRFEYVTDDEVNLAGLWIDDMSVPEIGWGDDAETPGGWEARGFVRIPNVLPQRWLVQLIEQGTTTRVTRLDIDETGHGVTVLGAGEPMPEKATIAVSGLTRWTRLPSAYQISVEPAQ